MMEDRRFRQVVVICATVLSIGVGVQFLLTNYFGEPNWLNISIASIWIIPAILFSQWKWSLVDTKANILSALIFGLFISFFPIAPGFSGSESAILALSVPFVLWGSWTIASKVGPMAGGFKTPDGSIIFPYVSDRGPGSLTLITYGLMLGMAPLFLRDQNAGMVFALVVSTLSGVSVFFGFFFGLFITGGGGSLKDSVRLGVGNSMLVLFPSVLYKEQSLIPLTVGAVTLTFLITSFFASSVALSRSRKKKAYL